MIVDWVVKEFDTLDLGHKRREDRVVKFVSQAAAIGESTPDRVRSKADLKAIDRLADNPRANRDHIFDAHHQSARSGVRITKRSIGFRIRPSSI